jgi:hypothetical protein
MQHILGCEQFGGNPVADKNDEGIKTTRRGLLEGALAGASFLRWGASSARAARTSPNSAGYRDAPKGDQNCANCSLFVSSDSCKLLAGEISVNGWCQFWKA